MTTTETETDAAEITEDDFRRTLVDLYPTLLRYARRLGETAADAEDLVHDALERGLRKRRYFRSGVPDRWMKTIVRNLFLDRRRHLQIRREIPGDIDRLTIEPAQPFNDPLDREELPVRRSDAYTIEDLRRTVRRLPPSLRTIYEMASFERASYREIGLRLSLKIDTVGTRLHRARRALRDIFDADSLVNFESRRKARNASEATPPAHPRPPLVEAPAATRL